MNVIAWLTAGAVVGWQVGSVMQFTSPKLVLLNIVAGAIGGALSGWLVSPLVISSTAGGGQRAFSFGALLTAMLGAVAMLALFNLLIRGTVH